MDAFWSFWKHPDKETKRIDSVGMVELSVDHRNSLITHDDEFDFLQKMASTEFWLTRWVWARLCRRYLCLVT